jgi:site-specific DNA-methyltransferase (adenine-specific)
MKGSNPGDVWRFSHVHYSNPNRQDHPTQKPEGVIERMILTSSNEGDIVVDPFSGSGTTLRVAQQLNRNAIGFEITKKYVEQTKARLKQSFEGFDSYDDRNLRVPNDLNDEKIREEYYKFHIKEFLKNDPNKVKRFKKDFYEKYKVKYE